MKLTEYSVTSIHADDKIDLVPGSQGFYTVLSVRALASHLLANYSVPEDHSIEMFVRGEPVKTSDGFTWPCFPKYVYFSAADTVTKIQPTES